MAADEEVEQVRSSLLQTSAAALQIRQRAEQELRRANDALEQRSVELAQALMIVRATLTATTDAIVVTDENARVLELNQQYLDLWKMPPEALQEHCMDRLWKQASAWLADPAGFLTRIREITEDAAKSFDVLELRDGRFIEQSSKILEAAGQQAGRVWSFRDVTDRYTAEIASRRLAAIVVSSDDAIVSKDLNSIITSWNAGAERIFGYSADEIVGTSIMRLIPPERQNEETDILSRIRKGQRIEHFETVRVGKTGQRIDVSVSISPLKDSTGKIVGASKIARDVTAAKAVAKALAEAKLQAERASRMKDEFLATLSHELRTPLNAILGWTTILKTEHSEGPDLEEGLAVIERNARAQTQIIEDLLDMSRIISGKVRLDAQRMDLPTVLKEAIDTLKATAEAKGVILQTVLDPFGGVITGDPQRMQQVFWNLLSNAVKFTPKGGQIQVNLQRVDSHVEVTVADTGEGIAPEFLPYVFDRFQQADASPTRRHGGLGLGLAIVKQLVELHGGRVAVQSRGKGHGAMFRIELPLIPVHGEFEADRRHPQTPERESRPLPAVSLHGLRILVVDDEADAREFVRRLLASSGGEVSVAGSANAALTTITAQVPDVLVCDIGMPEEDGYSLIRQIRALETSAAKLPAVALTAYARAEDRTTAIRSGFQNHLSKPVEPAELLAVVASLGGR